MPNRFFAIKKRSLETLMRRAATKGSPQGKNYSAQLLSNIAAEKVGFSDTCDTAAEPKTQGSALKRPCKTSGSRGDDGHGIYFAAHNVPPSSVPNNPATSYICAALETSRRASLGEAIFNKALFAFPLFALESNSAPLRRVAYCFHVGNNATGSANAISCCALARSR